MRASMYYWCSHSILLCSQINSLLMHVNLFYRIRYLDGRGSVYANYVSQDIQRCLLVTFWICVFNKSIEHISEVSIACHCDRDPCNTWRLYLHCDIKCRIVSWVAWIKNLINRIIIHLMNGCKYCNIFIIQTFIE